MSICKYLIQGQVRRRTCNPGDYFFSSFGFESLELLREISLLSSIKACTSLKDLWVGKILHEKQATEDERSNIYVATALITMYAKCGSMSDAHHVFTSMCQKDTVLWNTLLLGYADIREAGAAIQVLRLFARMQQEGYFPDARTFLAAVKACTVLGTLELGTNIGGKLVKNASLDKGMKIHLQAHVSGWDSNVYLSSSLVDFYAKCGSLDRSRYVFDGMQEHMVVTWNTLIMGYVDCGEEEEALRLYSRMRARISPDARTYVSALKACTCLAAKEEPTRVDGKLLKLKSLEKGVTIHDQALQDGFESDVFVVSALVSMYSRCGSMFDACRVFHWTSSPRDVVAWTALMLGHVENNEGEMALEVFGRMQTEGCCIPDGFTYLAAIKACTCLATSEEARKCGALDIKMTALERGMALHSQAGEYVITDVFVASSLVDMYAKCGNLLDARTVFDRMPRFNVVSWNSLLLGYAENGEGSLCLELFSRMEDEICPPDSLTFVVALKACTSIAERDEEKGPKDGRLRKCNVKCLEKGMAVHARAWRAGLDTGIFVPNTLVDMYAKCGSINDARRVFDKMESHNVVSWTSLLLGYSETGEAELALKLVAEFMELEICSCSPDPRTFVAALKACCQMTALDTARGFHREIYRCGYERDVILANCSLDLFSKCGRMVEAELVFDSLAVKTPVTWTSLMTGFSRLGKTERVFELFHAMQEEGLKPYDASYVCILTACSHAGLVDKGIELFQSMSLRHGVIPNEDHYHCIIDMFGRANRLVEALKFVEEMPYEACAITWRTLLSACHKWNNSQLGKLVFDKLLAADGQDPAGYSLMSNIYGSLGESSKVFHTSTL